MKELQLLNGVPRLGGVHHFDELSPVQDVLAGLLEYIEDDPGVGFPHSKHLVDFVVENVELDSPYCLYSLILPLKNLKIEKNLVHLVETKNLSYLEVIFLSELDNAPIIQLGLTIDHFH